MSGWTIFLGLAGIIFLIVGIMFFLVDPTKLPAFVIQNKHAFTGIGFLIAAIGLLIGSVAYHHFNKK